MFEEDDDDDLRENPCSLCPCCEAEEGNDICSVCSKELEDGLRFDSPEDPRELPQNITSMIWDYNEISY